MTGREQSVWSIARPAVLKESHHVGWRIAAAAAATLELLLPLLGTLKRSFVLRSELASSTSAWTATEVLAFCPMPVAVQLQHLVKFSVPAPTAAAPVSVSSQPYASWHAARAGPWRAASGGRACVAKARNMQRCRVEREGTAPKRVVRGEATMGERRVGRRPSAVAG